MKYTIRYPVCLDNVLQYWYFTRYDCGNYTITDCLTTYRVTARYLQKVFPDAYKKLIKISGVREYVCS